MSFFAPTTHHVAPTAHQSDGNQAAPQVTAAMAIKLIGTWDDLSMGQRRDLLSAVNSVCRVASVPPEMLILTPARLRAPVLQHNAVAWDVTPTNRSNILWRMSVVMKRLNLTDPTKIALTAQWDGLKTLLDKRGQMSLAAFFRFCTLKGVAPVDVSDPHLEEFEIWLINRTLIAEPRPIVTAARRAWNKAAAEIADWPKTKLATKSLRSQLLLPLHQFPESFRADVSGYAEKLSGENAGAYFGCDEDAEVSDDGNAPPAAKPLRPLTIESKLQRIKSAANALHRSGLPLAEIRQLADLVTPVSRPKAILKQLWEQNGKKPSPTLGHVAESLRQIAKYHTRLPANEVARIAKWGNEFGVTYKGMTTRNRKLLEHVMTRDRRTTLYVLPKVLFAEATAWGPCPRGALAAMRATMLALLLKCPMRLGNIIGLRLDEHLIRPDPKTGLITAIIIPADQTKNSRELVYPISEVTAGLLDCWLRAFRPLGAAPGNPYLFPGKSNGPMTRQGVRDTIKAITEERLGVAINPHAFRHLAARMFLDALPGAYESVRQLLGHADVNTTIRSYCGTEGEAAMKQFDEILEADHQTLGMKKAPRPRLPTARKSDRRGA